MREFKFRAWNKELGMSNVFCIDQGMYEAEPDAVMQYTGLKDKNGKEIYEGDILGGEYYVDGVAGEITVREDWGNCSFLEYKGGGDDFLFREVKHAEVIGNIYENPELLEQ